jgi:hypothetical protein
LPSFFVGKTMITAIVMIGAQPNERSPISWIQMARRAAATDLIRQIAGFELVERIIVISPEIGELAGDKPVEYIQSPSGSIHVGRYLANIVQRFQIEHLLYFGGGAAPLLDDSALGMLMEKVANSEECIFTNNQFASDWAGVVPAQVLVDFQERLPLDNMLGWVLSTEAGLPLYTLPPSAASRLDIDTPADLMVLRIHPETKPKLEGYLAGLALDTSKVEALMEVLARPASQVLIAGRLSPDPWRAINKVTRCWIRVISEERGMVSSGRLARGEVFSYLGAHIDAVGLQSFFNTLAHQVQAALIDTRVLLAHRGLWPAESDRFNSDLGLVDQIQDAWLREFTIGALEAPIPIVFGGHGLLSGDLFALSDLLRGKRGDSW